MKPREERLNDRLEQVELDRRFHGLGGQHPGEFMMSGREQEHDPEVEDLVALAQRLQQAHHLQVAPDFARQLEQRLLRHRAQLQLQRGSTRRSLFALLRARPALSAVLGLCVLVCLLSTSVLALAAQVTNPTSPLYGVRRWEQHVQIQMSSPADQAGLDLQFARDQLKTLPSLADAAHADAYHQALLDLDQQVTTTAAAVEKLPAGAQQTQLTGELASVKHDAIQMLRALLPRLALPEQLATTDELARLGDTVPILSRVSLKLPVHPSNRATVSFTGLDLQPGAHLLVNGTVSEATGTLQDGQLVFVVEWAGEQHPHSLGMLNPDGTAAETTAIVIEDAPGGNQHGNGNKPSATPTPHGNKPSATPTPHGNKPSATPTSHH
jgi:hypothetical protein